MASTMGISPMVVGLTLVSLGTSAPELVVCVFATFDGQGSLLIGNVLGSNLANIGLILGATAMIRPLDVAERVIAREVPIMIVLTIVVYPLVLDLELTRGEGGILLFLLAVYIAFTFTTAEDEVKVILEEVGGLTDEIPQEEQGRVSLRDVGLVLVGAMALGIGGRAIVNGASYLAAAFGASELVIGLTVVALGTSLPELVTSVVAADAEPCGHRRGEYRRVQHLQPDAGPRGLGFPEGVRYRRVGSRPRASRRPGSLGPGLAHRDHGAQSASLGGTGSGHGVLQPGHLDHSRRHLTTREGP